MPSNVTNRLHQLPNGGTLQPDEIKWLKREFGVSAHVRTREWLPGVRLLSIFGTRTEEAFPHIKNMIHKNGPADGKPWPAWIDTWTYIQVPPADVREACKADKRRSKQAAKQRQSRGHQGI